MKIIEEYLNQQNWREWERYFDLIPHQPSDRVLDLGCSVGGFAGIAAQYCAHITGVDLNPDFIAYCNTHKKENQTFICQDITTLDAKLFKAVNGVWCSYSLTYLADPKAYLTQIFDALAPGAWIACLDINHFISGNLPLQSQFHERVCRFEKESIQSGFYDFAFGHKIPQLLSAVGFDVIHLDTNVEDCELNFDGPASLEVQQNWASRLQRMPRLHQALSDDYASMMQELLIFLKNEQHQKRNNVWFAIGVKPQRSLPK